MVKKEVIDGLVSKWIGIAERDLLTAKQGLEAKTVITDTVCFHCQQAVEKYLKAFLVKHQVEFMKTHSIMTVLNLCSTVDKSFSEELSEVDYLTDYAVEIRYPDEWYEPTIEEAMQAFQMVLKVKGFVVDKLKKAVTSANTGAIVK
ncbi:MAG: HEPN domain-containing protein [Deltaproteobacteria bacterium]|nr:HEPN domain-containing protein [Deltaproteobacteria bacterium]